MGETLVVTLTRVNTLKGTVALGEPKQATTTIEDKGTATVKVESVAAAVTEEDGDGASQDAEFRITLEGEDFPADADVTVSYSTVNGSATADTDYAAAEGSVTLNASADSRTVTVTVATVPDTLAEGPETFMVTLSDAGLPDGVTLGIATATVTITETDNDMPIVSVVGPDRVPEGSEAIFTVKLAVGTGSTPIVVYYTLGGDATRADYEPPSGSLTIPAGQAMQTLVIPTLADDVVDWDETLEVMLTRASTTAGMVTISDVDEEAAATDRIADSGIVAVSVAGATVGEEDPAVFTVTLSGEVSEDVTVRYATDETAADSAIADADDVDDGDYRPIAEDATLTIVAGDTTGTFTVYTLHDTVAEAPETFTVRLSAVAERSGDPNSPNSQALPRGVELGAETATGTITDDDALTVSVRGPKTVAAGREPNVQYPVTLSGGTGSAPVVVNYTVSGTAADDYSPSSGTLIFPAASTDKQTIVVKQLAEPELGETLVVTLTGTTTAVGRVTLGTPRQATTAIKDANTGTLSVEDVTVEYLEDLEEGGEGGDAVFTVTLSASRPRDANVTIVYSTADGSAAAGTDYAAAESGATVVIIAEETTAMFTVSTKEDTLAEAAETFTVTLSAQNLPDGVTLRKATATATIDDNDTLTASIVGPASVGEGYEATYRVKLAGGTGSADIVVYYTVNGKAKSGEDYETPSGTLTIPSGQTEQTIVIPALSDDVLDQDEMMVVRLRKANTPAGTVNVSDSAFEIETTITDTSDVFVSVAHATADEGDPMMFTVTLSGAVASDVTVTYEAPVATAGRGIAAADDYTPVPSATLVIAEGEKTGTIVVATTENTEAEADETFTVTLTAANAGARLGEATATGTIEDDDVLTVNIVGPETVVEGETATYTATLTGGTGSDEVEVYYTVKGTAKKGDDYDPPEGTLTFGPEATPQSFMIRTEDDGSLKDDGETLVVSLTNATTTGTVNLGSARRVSTTIKEDATTVNVMADRATVTEGADDGDEVVFTVMLSDAPSVGPVTVRYTTANGTATADEDYADVTSAVTIAVGAKIAKITVAILDDSVAEAPETFSVRLEPVIVDGVTADVVFGTATVTIEDNEVLTASIVGPNKVPEGSPASFTVKLAGGTPSKPVTVYYTLGGTATKEDYRPPSGRLTIPAGKTTQTFAISTTSDNVLDRGETIDVMLTGAETAAGSVTPPADMASTMIADSSGPVTVSVADITVDEGHPALFTITLSGQVSDDVTVRYEAMLGTAEAVDYEADDGVGSVTIAAGDTTGTFTVRTVPDVFAEAPETFTVTLSEESDPDPELPDGVELRRTTATATITDDETLTARVVGPASVPAAESEAVYTVALEGGTGSATVVVNYTVSGSASNDYAPKSGTLPIAAESPQGTITLRRLHTLDEDDTDKTLVVSLTSATTSAGRATVGTPRAASSKISATRTPITPIVSLDGPDAGSVEETEDAQFTVNLTPSSLTDVTVKYETVTGGSATPNKDYAAVDSVVVIEAGATSAPFTVATIPDDLAEGAETFLVKLTDATVPPGGAPVGIGDSTVIVTIPANGDLTEPFAETLER